MGPTAAPAPPTASELAGYVGRYESDEIEAVFTVSAQGGRLVLQRDRDMEPAPLEPAGNGTFRFRSMTIRFEAEAAGAARALVVDAGRVRNIRFARVRGQGSD
jgi:hypothetical protein